jgi:hypothetical protein
MSIDTGHKQSHWNKPTAALTRHEIRCSWNPERSLPCTKQPTSCSHLEPDTSSPHNSESICEQEKWKTKTNYCGVSRNQLLRRFLIRVIYNVSDREIQKNLFLLNPLHCYALKQFVLDLYHSFKTTWYRNPPNYCIIILIESHETSSATPWLHSSCNGRARRDAYQYGKF